MLERCRTYSLENKCCRLLYDNPFHVSMADIDIHCIGVSNKTKCCWYKPPYINEVAIMAERKVMRTNQKHIWVINQKKLV